MSLNLSTATIPSTSPKLADKLYENLLVWISEGKFDADNKLPPELRLAREFGVSRSVVREALSRLRADRIIISRRGSGTYIQTRPKKEFFEFARLGGISDVMRCYEFRVALEGEAAYLAAVRRTEHDLSAMSRALEAMDKAARHGEIGAEVDMRFHNAIARSTGNHLFESAMAAIADYAISGITIARSLSLISNADRLRQVQNEHEVVFNAIKDQNSEAARDNMRRHISNSRMRLLSGESQF
ncbi:FadR/GntR family transcriptional regulator [Castellaniella sp.]|uniref:FadR/GntR family transcriptional regulator n=1 Tax=Castellaniella sp. TaxID=1955812 RepID=UPI00355DC1C0